MNKFMLTCLVAISAMTAISVDAQVSQNQAQRTTIWVTVTVERQEIEAGPYARYAQKYLGVAAPLADKVIHEVTAVKLLEKNDMLQMETAQGPKLIRPSHMNPASGFPRLTVDKTSSAAIGLEESARLAAEKIFAIRRSRFDLITGEVGENVFGGGLGSALAELSRLEEEYLSLFLGRETGRSESRRYRVMPIKGRLTYTVCRFSEDDGLLPQDDLSGIPLVLELQPASDVPPVVLNTQVKPSSRAVAQFIPADMMCRIVLDDTQLASEQFLIWQLGEMAYVNQ